MWTFFFKLLLLVWVTWLSQEMQIQVYILTLFREVKKLDYKLNIVTDAGLAHVLLKMGIFYRPNGFCNFENK
jgi:hypothetical protein